MGAPMVRVEQDEREHWEAQTYVFVRKPSAAKEIHETLLCVMLNHLVQWFHNCLNISKQASYQHDKETHTLPR